MFLNKNWQNGHSPIIDRLSIMVKVLNLGRGGVDKTDNKILFSAYLAFVKKINGNFCDPILAPFNNNNTELMPSIEETLIEQIEPETEIQQIVELQNTHQSSGFSIYDDEDTTYSDIGKIAKLLVKILKFSFFTKVISNPLKTVVLL